MEVKNEYYKQLTQNPSFIITSEIQRERFRKGKLYPALAIVLGVVLTATLGIMPIVASSIVGAILLILLGCITIEEAYKAVEWKIIFLLAGVLSLGIALEKTGAANYISKMIVDNVGAWGGNVALVSAFFLLTSLLTGVMSNNATGALLAPIAIATANSLGVSPRPVSRRRNVRGFGEFYDSGRLSNEHADLRSRSIQIRRFSQGRNASEHNFMDSCDAFDSVFLGVLIQGLVKSAISNQLTDYRLTFIYIQF